MDEIYVDWSGALPMLPGDIGPEIEMGGTATLEQTEAYERIVFPAVIEEPAATRIAQVEIPAIKQETYDAWTWSKKALYERAKELGIPGRGSMNKAELRQALIDFQG